MHVAGKINLSHNSQAIATSTLSDFMFRLCNRGDVMRQILCLVFKLFSTETGVFWLDSIFNTSCCLKTSRERRNQAYILVHKPQNYFNHPPISQRRISVQKQFQSLNIVAVL